MEKRKALVISLQSLTARSGAGMARLGFYISEELHKRGLLENFIISSKGKYTTQFPSAPVSVLSRYYLFLINRLGNLLHIKQFRIRFLQELLFDWFCRFRINSSVGAILTTNPYLYRTFKKAKRLGIKIFFLPANPEDNFIYHLVKEEQEKLGLHFADAYTYEKRLAYFNKSLALVDTIIGTFPSTYEQYMKTDKAGRVVHVPGHLTGDFKPSAPLTNTNPDSFNVCYLAYTVLLKGLPYLLEAWQDIMKDPGSGQMHLYIGGNIDSSLDSYIQSHFGSLKNVHYAGHISNVPQFFKDKDLFVIPSLIEGGPVTALEAAHYGLPVIITRNSGAREFFEDEGTGWVIPIRDAAAIKEKILWAYHHRDEARTYGLNAKKKLEQYSMPAFVSAIADTVQKAL